MHEESGDEWTTAAVSEIADSSKRSIVIGPFGSALRADVYSANGVPVLRGQDILGGRVLAQDGLVFVPEEVAAKFPACIAREGDLVFPHRGAIGRVGIVNHDKYLLSSSMMKLTCNRKLVEPTYLFYYFRGPGKEELLARASTVGTPGIGQPLQSLRSIKVRFPRISEQQSIAAILGALDDKIAANDRVLRLFDDLVRAKFRLITGPPRPFGEIAYNLRSKATPDVIDPETPYVGLEHIPRHRMWLSVTGRASSVTSTKALFSRGDILFGKLRPYFHKVVWAPMSGVVSTDALVIRAKKADVAGFALAAAASDQTIRACSASSTGTRMPRTSWKDLSMVNVPWPGDDTARHLSAEVLAIAEMAGGLCRESRALTDARDALLPLLMSGKIRVKDAEKVAGDVL